MFPGAVLCSVVFALAAPSAASAQFSAAIAAVQRVAQPDACRATMDFGSAQANFTAYNRVTSQRPAGYDVTVPGHSDPNASGADFESQWLVTNGYAYPQNVAAARLRTGCVPTTFSPSEPLQWHALDYIDPSTGRIDAWSNEGWGGAKHIPAFDTTAHSNQLDNEEGMGVWAPSCSPGKQTARFTRTLWLLGEPESLRIAVSGLAKNLRRWPFSKITVRLNGAVIVRQTRPGYLERDLDAAQLRLVEYGDNQLDVRVVKRVTGACNGGARQKLAVLIGVLGQQAWNVSLSRPPKQTTIGASRLPELPFTMTNNGPSVLLEPRFQFSLAYDQPVLSAGPLVNDNPGCSTTVNDAVVCGFGPLGPGQSVSFHVGWFARPKDLPSSAPRWRVKFTEYWEATLNSGGLQNGSFCVGMTKAECDAP